jgi:hypothetical protein
MFDEFGITVAGMKVFGADAAKIIGGNDDVGGALDFRDTVVVGGELFRTDVISDPICTPFIDKIAIIF